MMSAITKVALAGATGNLGPSILTELLASGFEVTVLSRSSTNPNLDTTKVRIAQVDYSSIESLKQALTGQDALVIALGFTGAEPHLNLVEAAVAAKVKRIIPSEFGSDTLHSKAAADLAVFREVFGDKLAVQKRLRELVEQSPDSSYTLLITGPFFDWGLQVRYIIDLKSPEPQVYDGGDQKISATTLSGIGKAVAGILRHPDETKNKPVYVRSVEISQNELLRIAGKSGVTPKHISTDDLGKAGKAELQKPEPNAMIVRGNLIRQAVFAEGYGGLFPREKLSNELLGVPTLSEDEVREIVLKYA